MDVIFTEKTMLLFYHVLIFLQQIIRVFLKGKVYNFRAILGLNTAFAVYMVSPDDTTRDVCYCSHSQPLRSKAKCLTDVGIPSIVVHTNIQVHIFMVLVLN